MEYRGVIARILLVGLRVLLFAVWCLAFMALGLLTGFAGDGGETPFLWALAGAVTALLLPGLVIVFIPWKTLLHPPLPLKIWYGYAILFAVAFSAVMLSAKRPAAHPYSHSNYSGTAEKLELPPALNPSLQCQGAYCYNESAKSGILSPASP